MYGEMYRAAFSAVAVTAAQDFFEVTAPADAAIVIHSVKLSQSTDAGDAEAEMLEVELHRREGAFTSGSGGSSITPEPRNTGGAAAGATVEANNTTEATGGTLAVLEAEAFNVQIGYLFQPTPEERIVVSPTDAFIVNLPTAPADSITVSGVVVFEEIGG